MFTYHKSYKSYKNRWVSGYNYACFEPQNLLLYFVKMRVINEKKIPNDASVLFCV